MANRYPIWGPHWRKGLAIALAWNGETVDLVNNTKFFETKNRKWVTVPLHPDLQEHLSSLASVESKTNPKDGQAGSRGGMASP